MVHLEKHSKEIETPEWRWTAWNHIAVAQITLHQQAEQMGVGGRGREEGEGVWGGGESRQAGFTIALLSAGAENFASIVAAREGRRESTVTMETSIPLTHTTNPLRAH